MSLRAISTRIKAVTNIQKITKTMKLVSAAKYARIERLMRKVRPYGEAATIFYERVDIPDPTERDKRLLLAVTSDRGLCGSLHSNVTRRITQYLAVPDNSNMKVICLGEKSTTALKYVCNDNILYSVNDIGRKPPTFLDASKVTNVILNNEFKFDQGTIIFNEFKSFYVADTTEIPIYSANIVLGTPNIVFYDDIDDEIVRNYLEYSIASLIFYSMIENLCSEIASRLAAMDNATKSAGGIMRRLTTYYNRRRQANITSELIEIISGAEVSKKK